MYILLLKQESYHYALSHDMTQAAWVKQSTGGRGLRPVGGYMMYTDIDLEYHSLQGTVKISWFSWDSSTRGHH